MALPSSPTLTNPDMILPGVDDYRFDTSSPKYPDHQASVNGGDWKVDWFAGTDFQLSPATMRQEPLTPIIYGNGTMLSDIGEVTEAENTPVKKSKPSVIRVQKTMIQQDRHLPMVASPRLGYDAVTKRSKFGNHQRQVSVESTDTIRTLEEPQSATAEYTSDSDDDAISVDDSNFQGDDEESVADSTYDHQLAYAQVALATKKENVYQIMSGEDTSSGALSRRAEAILANAKKRLDSMEGNLSRARNPPLMTPSSSASSLRSISPIAQSTPSSPLHDSRNRSRNSGTYSQNQRLDTFHNGQRAPRGYLSRSGTDSGSSNSGSVKPVPRPVSAIGGDWSASDPENLIERSYRAQRAALSMGSITPVEGLRDDENMYFGSRPTTAEPYLQPLDEHHELTRSTSSMQMRDLTEKMKGLKGKISDLRDRAREDSMRRRSVQSLRTPSPFTASKTWKTPSSATSGRSNEDKGGSRSPWGRPYDETEEGGSLKKPREVIELIQEDGSSIDGSIYEEFYESRNLGKTDEDFDHTDPSEARTNGHHERGYNDGKDRDVDDKFEGERSESVVSQYHDSLQTPVSHEDREDAFDYEHFFLHSAMGTISRERMQRRDSFSSEDSVETARAHSPSPEQSDPEKHARTARGHVRNQHSSASISTLATFETAIEGYTPEEDDDAENDYDYFRDGHEVEHGQSPEEEEDEAVNQVAQLEVKDPVDSPEHIKVPARATTPGVVAQNSLTSQWTAESYPESPLSSAIHPPAVHRPAFEFHKTASSISSFASSTGTTRSFPLVNKPKTSPSSTQSRPSSSSSPSSPLNSGRLVHPLETLMHSPSRGLSMHNSPTSALRKEYYAGRSATNSPVASIMENNNGISGVTNDPVSMLLGDDRLLVKQLVASMGKCVLGLQEAGSNTMSGDSWRKRMEIAKKILEGEEFSGMPA